MSELMTIFLSESLQVDRAGSSGRAIPGYTACLLDDDFNPLPPGNRGYLSVIGPTGFRYLGDPERQRNMVKNGWNVTGDIVEQDADGWFWHLDRSDEMIKSGGHNISALEVEAVLIKHPKVAECAVVGVPDPVRGKIVRACVVLRDPTQVGESTAREIQEFVKATIAPYKYPREVHFLEALPKGVTGKIQRAQLRQI
jgi:2-aminobenzoate-CoA ligase